MKVSPEFLRLGDLKKQSQFAWGLIWRNTINKNDLGEFVWLEAAKKQTQTKPIYSYCVMRDVYCENQFWKNKANYEMVKIALSQ